MRPFLIVSTVTTRSLFVQFGDGWLDYHLVQVFELLIFSHGKHGSEIIDSSRSVTGAAELLEQLVNADAVGAGKAETFFTTTRVNCPLSSARYGMMASEKVISHASP